MPKPCQTAFAHQRRALLQRSLINLMDRVPYTDITVKDICQEARIPRRTFYHYFEHKDDVLDSIVEDTMSLCFLEVTFDQGIWPDPMRHSFARIFRFWLREEHRRTLDILLKNDMASRLMTFSMNWVRVERFDFLVKVSLDPKLVEIGLMVGVTDFFSLLFYWGRNGYRETPEQMADYAVWVLPQAFCKL